LKERIDTFVVLPEYSEREQEAAELTQSMGVLADENTADRLLIEDLEQAMATEAPPPATDVDGLYAESGIALPDSIARRFDEVRRFHASIVDNRRSHLSDPGSNRRALGGVTTARVNEHPRSRRAVPIRDYRFSVAIVRSRARATKSD
jgi:uncharacterized protein YydD (DUF2326 family)